MPLDEGRVSLPIRCPVCGEQVITQYRTVDIVGAVINGRPIHLYAACHDRSWIASYIEIQQIRACLGSRGLDAEGRAPFKDISPTTDD